MIRSSRLLFRPMTKLLKYPKFKRTDHSYVLHNQTIHDPYAWLENPDAEDTQAFVTAQNNLSQSFFRGDNREMIYKIAEKLQNYPRKSIPTKRGDYYYYFANTGLQNQDVLYRTKDYNEKGEVFLDPNTWSEDGTHSIAGMSYTKDGSLVAISKSKSGSDWKEISFIRTDSSAQSADPVNEVLIDVKFGGATWLPGNKGIIYPRFKNEVGGDGTETAKNEHMELYYHKIGTPQSQDVLFLRTPAHPTWMFSVEVTDDNMHMLVYISDSCDPNTIVYIAKMKELFPNDKDENNVTSAPISDCFSPLSPEAPVSISTASPFKPILSSFSSALNCVTTNGESASFVVTDKTTPRGCVRTVALSSLFAVSPSPLPAVSEWLISIPQCEQGGVLDGCSPVHKDFAIVSHMRDVCSAVCVYKMEDKNVWSPVASLEDQIGVGSIYANPFKRDHSEVFFKLISYTTPGDLYRLDLSHLAADASVEENGSRVSLQFLSRIPLSVDMSAFTTEILKVASTDGKVKLPVFLSRSKASCGKTISGPILVYGYGGFNISLTPHFSSTYATWLSAFPDSAVAICCIRGGGEYGDDWYKAGTKQQKQTVFDDFFACAEYLADHVSSVGSKNLVCMGGSNGGTLVGACVSQRPELFGAALCQVPVMDMFKFHKFTIGHAWTSDFGNPEKEDEFESIKKWSPLHNIKDANQLETKHETVRKWPALLVLTADHDDRVVPLHSLKFLAEAQAKVTGQLSSTSTSDQEHESEEVILGRIDVKAGHGAGKSTAQRIAEVADMFAFVGRTLNVEIDKSVLSQ
eukprot:GDKJ01026187.1.p1 GENE.GDKJ01026187.1~~GDKJ01026187.1.p1  ORF type:complete len:801 (-),score=182.40 GDKJ01026187.1:61-2463(-)